MSLVARITGKCFQSVTTRCRVCLYRADRVVCAGCLKVFATTHAVCRTCASRLPVQADSCTQCPTDDDALRYITAPYNYQFPLDRMLHRLKYRSDLTLLPVIDALLIAVSISLPGKPDVLVPVPLHRRRLRQRGFNQAEHIAGVIGRQLDLPVVTDLVERFRSTNSQTGLSASDRRENVSGAFRVRRPVDALRICLVDDVITTGATLDSLATTLMHANAESVSAVALAFASAR